MEWDSYQNFMFTPLRPCVLFGPSGMSVQAPKMAHKFTVIEWWKDIMFFFGSLLKNKEMARLAPPPFSLATPTSPLHPRESSQPPLAPPRPLAGACTPPRHLPPAFSARLPILNNKRKTLTRKSGCRS
jgi:hypothetical protein